MRQLAASHAAAVLLVALVASAARGQEAAALIAPADRVGLHSAHCGSAGAGALEAVRLTALEAPWRPARDFQARSRPVRIQKRV